MDEIKPDLVDELLKGYEKPEDIIGENGLLKRLTKALLERALNAELTHHLGYEKHDPAGHHSGNSRNGVTSKTVKGEFGEMLVEGTQKHFCLVERPKSRIFTWPSGATKMFAGFRSR